MNINSRPLSLNMLANVDKFAGRLGCLGCLGYLGCLEEMPLDSEFEGDFLGCRGCLERCLWVADSREISLVAGVASKDAFGRRIRGRLFWLPRLPRKMPSGGRFEGDFLGCWGCLERCLRAADSREITLVAEVASKRCLRAADSREIILAAGSPRSDRQYN